MRRLHHDAGSELPSAEPLAIALRAYAAARHPPAAAPQAGLKAPSPWTLIFDTETTVDAVQRIRFGVYQVRNGGQLHRRGIFHDPNALSVQDVEVLEYWARCEGFEFLTCDEFVEEIFYRYAYDRCGTVVGFNLPFDLSRLAIGHGSARGRMRGGFSLKLSERKWRPRVQVKHLSARAAMIQFAKPGKQLTPRGMRNRGLKVPAHRGFFVDLKTLAAALTATSHSLKSLADFLQVELRKLCTEEHGGPITDAYVSYAARDVQTTWECYQELMARYHEHGLRMTSAHKIKSEAGLGKAYLREMGILPWRQAQPGFSSETLGAILSAYYGGRAEVRWRRNPVEIQYCDFLSMYPTVCVLMGLWRFVIADGMTSRDSTEDTRELLERIQVSDLQKQEFWPQLRTLVQIRPEADIFPVRAPYGHDAQRTIGLNYFTSAEPIWLTLADCIASKLLTGKAPHVTQAVTYDPGEIQAGLNPVHIMGRSDYPVHPTKDDFYKRLIDLRAEVQRAMKLAHGEEKERLDNLQLALKILANATSYGIFIELNVEEVAAEQTIKCFGLSSQPFEVRARKIEEPGTYFHPLLAVLITGAARLMLAITERLAADAGLDWAFCDTDSMALGRPDGMTRADFRDWAEKVRSWFSPLNPYTVKRPLLKLKPRRQNLWATSGSGSLPSA